MPEYKIKQGDCLSSIAEKHGLFWEKVWSHPKNSSLKRPMSKYQLMKPLPIEQSNQLTKQARMPYHDVSSLLGFGFIDSHNITMPYKEDFFK